MMRQLTNVFETKHIGSAFNGVHGAENLFEWSTGLRISFQLKEAFIKFVQQIERVFNKPLLVTIHCQSRFRFERRMFQRGMVFLSRQQDRLLWRCAFYLDLILWLRKSQALLPPMDFPLFFSVVRNQCNQACCSLLAPG